MSLRVAGKYPWRVGVTSYLLPADLVANVEHIADRVDDVQLLFFESAANADLTHPVDIPLLQQIADRHGLSYTVHLPTDIRLGAADKSLRKKGLDEIERLVAELSGLEPICYDLHLNKEPTMPDDVWRENLAVSLSAIKVRLGEKSGRIAVENIDYPLELIWDLVVGNNFGLCLDMGHILKYGHDWQRALAEYVPAAQHIHYHGVQDGKDHQSITVTDMDRCRRLGAALQKAEFKGVLTLELYSFPQFLESADILEKAWKFFEI